MAGYDQIAIQRARFAIESSTFGDDLTDDIATNFFDLRIEPTRLIRKPLTVPDPTIVQRAFQQRNHVISGPARAECPITALWNATGQALNTATSPTKTSQSKMLEALLGGYSGAAGSAVASGASTTGAVVTGGHGSRFSKGSIIAFILSGAVYPVLVTNVATDTLSWWPALPGTPSVADVVYNSQTIYLTDQPSTQIQMLHEAAKQRGNIWLGKGGQGDFALDLTRGQLAKWTSALQFANHEHDDEFDVPVGGSAIAAGTYDGTGGVIAFRGGCHFAASASSTRTLVKVHSITIDFARKWFEVGKHNGVEGLDGWQLDTRGERKVELTLLADDPYEDYHDAFLAETDMGLLLWLDRGGSAAGYGQAIAIPTMQIMSAPEPTEVFGGLEGLKLSLLVKENGKTTSPTTEQHYSPIVLGHY